jgi:regulator of CtrA degradation
VVDDFARSELFDRTFHEGMELVEETAAYLDGDGRRESKLLSRATALAYAGESMKLTTRLMQIASWLLVQRAVREGDMTAEAACETRYRLADRKVETEAEPPELPIALVEYLVRADKLYDRVLHLDRRMYLDEPEEDASQSCPEPAGSTDGGVPKPGRVPNFRVRRRSPPGLRRRPDLGRLRAMPRACASRASRL